jgi:predicted transposase YbfD/YdcC
LHARWSQPGIKKAVVTIDATGCKDSTTAEVTQNITKPILSATGDELTCDSLNASTDLSSTPSTGITIVWSGAGLVSGGNTLHARWSQPGIKKAVVTIDATGCKDSTTAEVTQNITKPILTCTTDTLSCDSTNASTTVSSDPSVGITIVWNGTGLVSGQGTTHARWSEPGTKKAVVAITATGCKDSCAVEVFPDTVKPICSVSPADTTICAGDSAKFCVNPSEGKPPYIYSWEGPNGYTSSDSCITVSDSGTYSVILKGANGCADTCQAILRHEPCGEEHCGLTQGAYGNYGGKYFGKGTLELIEFLIDGTPLVVGKPGRSITIPLAAAECIIARLPGSGTPARLPATIGDDTLSWSSCQTSPPLDTTKGTPQDRYGRFKNVLLAQTITLSLNVRLSCDVGSFDLCNEIETREAFYGPDGAPCTDDDIVNPDTTAPVETNLIPQSVLTALSILHLSPDVDGLLELANRALAYGVDSTGGATLSQINMAVDAINEAFDECRFVTYCGAVRPIITLSKGAQSSASVPTEFTVSQNYPNPFNPVCMIAYALPTDCQVRLDIYNILGQKVRVLVDEYQSAGYKSVTWDGKDDHGQELASGVYFYRLEAGNFTQARKMVLMK